MINETLSTQLAQTINSAQTIIVLLDKNASFDQSASAIALAQSLIQSGKQVTLASPSSMAGLEQLSGQNLLTSELGNQSLLISFDYSEEKVDKISYHIGEETGKFYLTVKPRRGVEPLDPKTVEYSYAGADADLLILFGVNELEDLEHLYFGYEELYRKTSLISINHFETSFGTLKIDTSSSPTVSEFVFNLIEKVGLSINADIATDLLTGLEQASQRFQSRSLKAESFEVVAKLLKLGARRILSPINANSGLYSEVGAKSKNSAVVLKKNTTEPKSINLKKNKKKRATFKKPKPN